MILLNITNARLKFSLPNEYTIKEIQEGVYIGPVTPTHTNVGMLFKYENAHIVAYRIAYNFKKVNTYSKSFSDWQEVYTHMKQHTSVPLQWRTYYRAIVPVHSNISIGTIVELLESEGGYGLVRIVTGVHQGDIERIKLEGLMFYGGNFRGTNKIYGMGPIIPEE